MRDFTYNSNQFVFGKEITAEFLFKKDELEFLKNYKGETIFINGEYFKLAPFLFDYNPLDESMERKIKLTLIWCPM